MLTSLAEKIIFGNVKNEEDIAKAGFVLRANKTLGDVTRAVHRGRKQGSGKFEHEISSIAVQLKTVLKVKR